MFRTTLSAQGNQLPIGVEAGGGERIRTYAFRRWNAAVELEIGKTRDKERGMTSAAFATEILAKILSHWGPHDFSKMSDPERLLAIKRSFAGDVYHVWIQLRRDVIGNDLDIDLTCICRHKFTYSVDLGTLEEDVVADDEEISSPFGLRDGFEYRGEIRKVVTLDPTRWMTFEGFGPEMGLNPGAIKLALMEGTIVGVNGVDGRVRLTENDLRDLGKYDFEKLATAIGERQPGPSLLIHTECPKCRSEIDRSMGWTYDSFFSAGSSRSEPPKKSDQRSSTSATGSRGSPSR
jgi:hypothetical protein